MDHRASDETKRESAKLILNVARRHRIVPRTINEFDLMPQGFVYVTPEIRDAILAIDPEACDFFPIPNVYCQSFEEELGH